MLIAEIGINHNGDLEVAKEMIKAAREAGADIVKFQKRDLDLIIPQEERNKPKSTPWGEMTYMEYKQRLEFGQAEYDEIDAYCDILGIPWTASVWDHKSLDFILQYNVPFIKIPSACITYPRLLTRARDCGKPVLISDGMSTELEVKHAINILGHSCMGVLHTNSCYPSPIEDLNLKAITYLKERYQYLQIGYSGHEEGITACLVAIGAGATILEKHVTLDKRSWGSDQSSSIDMEELRILKCMSKSAIKALGKPEIKCFPMEAEVKKKLRLEKEPI